MAIGSQNAQTDGIINTGAGVPDTTKGKVVALRWASANRLYVLCQRAVVKYDLVADAAAPGCVTPSRSRDSLRAVRDPQAASPSPPSQVLRRGRLSDFAVHDPMAPARVVLRRHDGGPGNAGDGHAVVVHEEDRRTRRTRNDATHGVKRPYAVVVIPAIATMCTSARRSACGRHVQQAAVDVGSVLDGCLRRDSGFDDRHSGHHALLRGGSRGASGRWICWHPAPRRRSCACISTTRRVAPGIDRSDRGRAEHRPSRTAVRSASCPPGIETPNPTGLGLGWRCASSDPYGLWVLQTAMHGKPTPDRLVRSTGQWTPQFQPRLRALRAASADAGHLKRTSARARYSERVRIRDGAAPTEADLRADSGSCGAGRSPASIGVRRYQSACTCRPSSASTGRRREREGDAHPSRCHGH